MSHFKNKGATGQQVLLIELQINLIDFENTFVMI